MKVTVIGLGLIGGSLARSLRKNGLATSLVGVETNASHAEEALQLGLVDQVQSLEEGCAEADLVVLAIPVDAARQLVLAVLDLVLPKAVVADMGSTKEGICKTVEKHEKRGQFVAAHPIAGTENNGPRAAIDGLFAEKVAIICNREQSSEAALECVEEMFRVLQMNVISMNSKEHDEHIAYVSHLSHISSFALGNTVLEIEKDEKSIFNMAGSGFASTVRLAKSAPSMWAPIFAQNHENISAALAIYINKLTHFKKLIDEKDVKGLASLMSDANEVRRVLEGIELNNNH
jgi:prephenate dehydrogenase